MTESNVENTKKTRRKFLTGAAGVAAGGAAAVAMPNVARAAPTVRVAWRDPTTRPTCSCGTPWRRSER